MRYLPLTSDDRRAMLDAIGVDTIDALFEDVPEVARLAGPIAGLPDHQGELAVERTLSAMAAKNLAAGAAPFFVGAGAYKHHVPASVDHLIQRSEFLTSYTPYQPEISQGTLQALFEFQTQVSMLLGLEIANASLYDGSTACAEAALMAARVTKRDVIVLAPGLHPHYAAVVRTNAEAQGLSVETLPPAIADDASAIGRLNDKVACLVVQTPNVFGTLVDLAPFAEAARKAGALLVSATTEVVSLGLIKSPGEMGADIAVAEGQSIGVGLNFGGPYVGLFACRNDKAFLRQIPGRLAGETLDADGRRGFVLTLSSREQHIRRDKATSNICTNSGLCALAWTIHMTLLGEAGLKRLARLNHEAACATADALEAIPGVEVLTPSFFNEFAVRLPKPAAPIVEALAAKGVLAGAPASRLWPNAGLDDVLLVAATECVTDADIARLADEMKRAL